MTPRTRLILVVLTGFLAGCNGCVDEAQSSFFEPTTWGEYEYEPEPDIDAPTLVDFGQVSRGESALRRLTVRNVGRLPLKVSDVRIDGDGFSIAEAPELEWSAEPGDGRVLLLEFAASSNAPARGELIVFSNDPDEPEYAVALLANQTEPCVGTITVDAPIWEVHDGEGPMCFPDESPEHGHEVEFDYAAVPDPDDSGWREEPDDDIEFERRSTLCGFECECRDGGDFTYFQTSLFIPEGATVQRYHVEIADVDDGARVTVFNDRYPGGVTDPDAYARLFGQQADVNLAPYLQPGQNRIVITQVDDCCSVSRLMGVTVNADGAVVDNCRD